jgi:hypothetical protein
MVDDQLALGELDRDCQTTHHVRSLPIEVGGRIHIVTLLQTGGDSSWISRYYEHAYAMFRSRTPRQQP